MRLVIEPTAEFFEVAPVQEIDFRGRVWEGVDEHGQAVRCLVYRVMVPLTAPPEAQDRFAAELKAAPPPLVILLT